MLFFCYNKNDYCDHSDNCDDCDVWVLGKGGKEVPSNADRVRAMNDDLLATQLTQIFQEGVMALTKVNIPNEILNEIRTQILEKLQQPAEEVI